MLNWKIQGATRPFFNSMTHTAFRITHSALPLQLLKQSPILKAPSPAWPSREPCPSPKQDVIEAPTLHLAVMFSQSPPVWDWPSVSFPSSLTTLTLLKDTVLQFEFV